jgi:hypothetical protein
MYWRDKVILEVAKKMHSRTESRSSSPLSWDDLDQAFKEYWLKKAERLIEDVRDGAKEAGWSIEFVGRVSY